MLKKSFPEYFYNPISFGGFILSAVSFGLILFLIVLELFTNESKPYMGIIAFIILPIFLIIGLILTAYGGRREFNRIKKGITKEKIYPKIDLNDPKTRTLFIIVNIFGVLFLALTAFGSFKAYEYTDSDDFCGTLCHKVMNPEFTAYQSSPHARVGCVKCHIGGGADWFVKAKISGAYQVYSVLFDKYSKPIPTPVEHLRPAQQTCEQCHWPQHFFSEKRIQYANYMKDENNTRFDIDLILKVGGGNIDTGPTSGIHWHMNIAQEIYYYASDQKRLLIPYVKTIDKSGRIEEYFSSDLKVDPLNLHEKNIRRMDCIDCHNRPSHNYHAPAPSVNHLLAVNLVDKKLPFIKSKSVEALDRNYSNTKIALDSISISLKEFYQTNYPEVYEKNFEGIKKSIKELQRVYQRNYFPEMGVKWSEYPEHIGHLFTPGCFRCHDGKHISKSGKIIIFECDACHSILRQKYEGEPEAVSITGLKYVHPVDIGNSWEKIICSDCHNKSKVKN